MRQVIGHPIQYRVAFLGPHGVGKSTAVRALCGEGSVHTRVGPRDATAALDLGVWARRDGTSIALVGTPGLPRFRVVQPHVAERSWAFALLVFGDHEHSVDAAIDLVHAVGDDRVVQRLVLAVTRADAPDCPPRSSYESRLRAAHLPVPVVSCDPREATDVARLVLRCIDQGDRASAVSAARRRRARHGALTKQQRMDALLGSMSQGRGA